MTQNISLPPPIRPTCSTEDPASAPAPARTPFRTRSFFVPDSTSASFAHMRSARVPAPRSRTVQPSTLGTPARPRPHPHPMLTHAPPPPHLRAPPSPAAPPHHTYPGPSSAALKKAWWKHNEAEGRQCRRERRVPAVLRVRRGIFKVESAADAYGRGHSAPPPSSPPSTLETAASSEPSPSPANPPPTREYVEHNLIVMRRCWRAVHCRTYPGPQRLRPRPRRRGGSTKEGSTDPWSMDRPRECPAFASGASGNPGRSRGEEMERKGGKGGHRVAGVTA
ncbi:hypothetical protein B0H12DRAFT_1243669 [Mycena haematopus]|nr:hypothetical protein B0H12DRAFT_1243669 [Mycena haematopus]